MLAAFPILMGSNCSPTRTARSISCTGRVCPVGSNGVQQLPRCINFCANQPPLASAEGARCAVDACNNAAWAPANVFMCPANYGCVPNPADPGYGNCRESAPDYIGACEVDGSPPCPTQSYCRQFSASFPRPTWFRPTTAAGACVTWRREGDLCNGNSDSTTGAEDLRCEPGTLCLTVLDPILGTPLPGVRRCQRSCESDNDCPCTTAARPISCSPTGGSLRTCSYCTASGQQCDTGSGAGPCCDPLATCGTVQGVPGVPSGTRQCCRPNGTTCSTHAECCGTSRCSGGTCQACSPVGAAPGGPGCCPGLTAVTYSSPSPFAGQTLCSEPCQRARGDASTTVTTGQTCTPNTAAPGCTGTVLCGPRGYDCIRSTGTADTTCNNLDEDCDGLRDDDWTGTTCTPSLPPGVMCQTGFSPQGDQQCSSGSVSCRLRPFCSTDDLGFLRSGSAGGRSCESRQVFCTSAAQCQASERCGPSTSSTCGPGVVGCCASRACPTCPETWSWCCTSDLSKINTCYYPTT
jgi:hypothetical protein